MSVGDYLVLVAVNLVTIAAPTFVAGSLLGRRKATQAARLCSCGHALSHHRPKGNTCAWKKPSYPYLECTCQQYDGPERPPTLAELMASGGAS